jgi:hypothetical protein
MLICKGNFRGYMADSIRLYEVGMRDGLQTIEKEVTTDQKVALAEMLIKAGLDKIEIGERNRILQHLFFSFRRI